jgi:hypothetical protein
LKQLPLDWRALLGAAVLLAAVGIGIYLWRRRPNDPEEIERRRRAHLNQVGRIVEGQVVEIRETPVTLREPAALSGTSAKQKPSVAANGARARRMLVCYTYSISGVSYETAQDVTGLEERACIERLAAGQPASVKYDPANPSDSILIADDWSGLH